MSLLLQRLSSKKDVDDVIRGTDDLVLVLRFGRESDLTCMLLDEILAKTADKLKEMARVYIVDMDSVPIYVNYFDISLIPATIFFFNGQHIKVDWGTPDNTKFIGAFKTKQDFIDVIEVIYRAALKGKMMLFSPLDPANVPKYDLVYKDI